MISTYRINPQINSAVIVWGIASAAIRTQRVAVCFAKLSATRLLSLYVTAIVACIVVAKVGAMVPIIAGSIVNHKLFRFTLAAGAVVTVVVGLALLAAAQPLLLVGGALIAVYGVMTWSN